MNGYKKFKLLGLPTPDTISPPTQRRGKTMYRRTRFVGFFFLVLTLCTAAAAQQAPSTGGEEAAVKRVIDGIMEPYISLNRLPGAIVGVSLHGHRYYFPYGKATDSGAPFASDTLVEIGSCTKTFTTTLFALAINRKQMDPNASAQKYMPAGYKLRPEAQEMTPLELADFTSGMPDDPTDLPHRLEQRSIEHYTTKDFLTWVSRWKPVSTPPAQYLYSNAGIGLLGYLILRLPQRGISSSIRIFLRLCQCQTRRCVPRPSR